MKKITIIKTLILIVFSLGNLYPQSKLENSKAIIVNNEHGEWEDNPKIQIELERVLGGLDEEDENFIFYNPSEVDFDSKGNLYVLDTGNSRIQKYLEIQSDEPCLSLKRRTWAFDRVACFTVIVSPGTRYKLAGRFSPRYGSLKRN